MSATRLAPGATERYPVGSCGEPWVERLGLEHETLAPVESVSREGDEIRVRRARRGAGNVAGTLIPRRAGAGSGALGRRGRRRAFVDPAPVRTGRRRVLTRRCARGISPRALRAG